jgi:hypothetical protein
MCVNLQTSIAAFIIGEICGFILATENNEKRAIGIFVMFYSFVQLFEALIYYYGNDESTLASRLLLINLGLQGIVFFILVNYFIKVNAVYFFICGMISLFIIYKATVKDFKSASIESCMKWNFMDTDISSSLGIMYITVLVSTQISSNTIINNTGKYFILTYIFANLFNSNGPSLWCLSSAITAPILLFL